MMYSRKEIWQVTYPILLGLLAQNVINVTDTAFLGHVGEVALGASAMGGLLYICIYTVAFGFSIGSQILIARRNGEQNYRNVGPIMWQGSVFSLMMAAALLVLMYVSARPLIRVLISSDAIFEATYEFFTWRIWGFLFAFLNVMFRALYIGITQTKVLTWSAVVMAVVNVFLDYVLVFGEWGFPEMGVRGAALASVIAEASSLLFYLLYTYYKVDRKKYGLNHFGRLDMELVFRILRISAFTMVQYFLAMAIWFVFFMALERLGQRELAIANIVRSVYVVMLIPVQSLSTTANSLVSNLIGAGGTSHVLQLLIPAAGPFGLYRRCDLGDRGGTFALCDMWSHVVGFVCLCLFQRYLGYGKYSGCSGTGNCGSGVLCALCHRGGDGTPCSGGNLFHDRVGLLRSDAGAQPCLSEKSKMAE